MFLIFTTQLYQFFSVFFLLALFSDEPEVFFPKYSQTAILHFRRAVNISLPFLFISVCVESILILMLWAYIISKPYCVELKHNYEICYKSLNQCYCRAQNLLRHLGCFQCLVVSYLVDPVAGLQEIYYFWK